MTCVIALKLRDKNGPRLAVQVPLFPEAAFPADTVAASENRSGLYLESNGIFEMVRNLVKNTDDVRHPYITPLNTNSHAGLPPAILLTNGFDPLRDVGHAYAQKLAAPQRPDLHAQSRPHPRIPAVHTLIRRLPPSHPRPSRPDQSQDRIAGPPTLRAPR